MSLRQPVIEPVDNTFQTLLFNPAWRQMLANGTDLDFFRQKLTLVWIVGISAQSETVFHSGK